LKTTLRQLVWVALFGVVFALLAAWWTAPWGGREMKAVAAHFPLEEVVPGAVAAGVDGLLVCHHADVQNRAVDLLRQAVEQGRVSPARLDEARGRIARLLSWAAPPGDPSLARSLLRRPEALALAARLPNRTAGRDPTAA